jgi:hypothetical protein
MQPSTGPGTFKTSARMVSFTGRDKGDQDVLFLDTSLFKSFTDNATYKKLWVWIRVEKKMFVFAFSWKLLAKIYRNDRDFCEYIGEHFQCKNQPTLKLERKKATYSSTSLRFPLAGRMGKVSLSSRRVDCGSIVLIIESSLRGGRMSLYIHIFTATLHWPWDIFAFCPHGFLHGKR